MRPDAVHAVIAVKNLERAKSRLAGELPPADRSRLVLAMLSDTVSATLAAGIGSVTVVTPDSRVAAAVRALGCVAHPDPAAGADLLNSALADAAAAVRARHGAVDLLALQADLPALRPGELADALATAPATGRALVADHTGQGTAALLVRDGTAASVRPPPRSWTTSGGPTTFTNSSRGGAIRVICVLDNLYAE